MCTYMQCKCKFTYKVYIGVLASSPMEWNFWSSLGSHNEPERLLEFSEATVVTVSCLPGGEW